MTEHTTNRVAMFRHGQRIPEGTPVEDGWVVDIVVDVGIVDQLHLYRGRIRGNPDIAATVEIIPDTPAGLPNPDLGPDYVPVTTEQIDALREEWAP